MDLNDVNLENQSEGYGYFCEVLVQKTLIPLFHNLKDFLLLYDHLLMMAYF